MREKNMKKSESAWSDQEVFELFKLIENYKKHNRAVIKAFEKYALISNRKKNSVRNYYYSKLKEFENNIELAQKFNINFKWHTKNEQVFFTPEETELSINEINNLLSKGYSVRKACFKVACGDVKKMLRLQNKYRSIHRQLDKENQKANSSKSKKDISKSDFKKELFKTSNFKANKKGNLEKEKSGNVLIMPHHKSSLSDSEITSLFMGLVKLVKKSAREQCDLDMINEIQSANFELRKSIKTLAEKDREIKLFRKKFEILTNEKQKLKEELNNLRSQNAELINSETSPMRLNKLKSYINKLGKTITKETT